jgi:hypothetical protein
MEWNSKQKQIEMKKSRKFSLISRLKSEIKGIQKDESSQKLEKSSEKIGKRKFSFHRHSKISESKSSDTDIVQDSKTKEKESNSIEESNESDELQ